MKCRKPRIGILHISLKQCFDSSIESFHSSVWGVGRFVDKMFRRRISGRFVDSIINVIPPLRDSSSYYSFHSLGLKYFQFVFQLVTRHLAAYIVRACRSGSVTWPSRPRERGAGGAKLSAALTRSDPGPSLWRCHSVILLCYFKPIKVAKYHKYSSDIQINVVKVSLPHTIF